MRSRLDARPRSYAFVAAFALLRPPTFSHASGVFSFFMRKRTFVFSLAPSGAFSFVFAPRGAAACSIRNPHQRVTASSPECSRPGGETLGKSNNSIQNPEHSEWVAEAGASRFPMNGRTGFPWSIRETKSCPAGKDEPQARFHLFAAPSHTPQGVFSSFMRKRTFVLSLAPSGAFSFVFRPTRRSRVLYSEPAPAGDSQ